MVDSWIGDDFYRHGAFRTVMLVIGPNTHPLASRHSHYTPYTYRAK